VRSVVLVGEISVTWNYYRNQKILFNFNCSMLGRSLSMLVRSSCIIDHCYV